MERLSQDRTQIGGTQRDRRSTTGANNMRRQRTKQLPESDEDYGDRNGDEIHAAGTSNRENSGNESDWTTELVTKQHIHRLQEVWQQTNDDLTKERERSKTWETKAKELWKQCRYYELLNRIKEYKLALSNRFSISPENPFLLLKELQQFIEIPLLSEEDNGGADAGDGYENLLDVDLACIMKTGDSWLAMSTNSTTEEDLIFKSKNLENFLKFRGPSVPSQKSIEEDQQGFSIMESLHDVLPSSTVDYLLTGTIPEFTAERIIYSEQSEVSLAQKRHGHHHGHTQRKGTSTESSGIFIKPSGGETASRCLFVLTVKQQPSFSQQTSASQISSFDKYCQSLHMAFSHPIALNIDTKEDILWKELFEHGSQLMLTSVVRLFESRAREKVELNLALKTALLTPLEDEKLSKSPAERLGQSIKNLEVIVEDELRKRENQLPEIDPIFLANDDESQSSSSSPPEVRIQGNFFVSSLDMIESETIPFVDIHRHVIYCPNNIRTTSGENFDDVKQSVLVATLESNRPQLRTFSRLSSQTKVVTAVAVDGNNIKRKDNNVITNSTTMMVLEHHLYLCIPVVCKTYNSVFGCILIQLVTVSADEDLASLQRLISGRSGGHSSGIGSSSTGSAASSSLSLVLPVLHQSLIHNLSASVMSTEIGEAMTRYLCNVNFSPVGLFSTASNVSVNDKQQSMILSELELVEEWKSLMTLHNQKKIENGYGENEALSQVESKNANYQLDDFDNSFLEDPSEDEELEEKDVDDVRHSNDGSHSRYRFQRLMNTLTERLDSDWSLIITITKDDQISGEITNTLRHRLHLTVITNTGNSKTISWNSLPIIVKKQIHRLLHVSSKLQGSSNEKELIDREHQIRCMKVMTFDELSSPDTSQTYQQFAIQQHFGYDFMKEFSQFLEDKDSIHNQEGHHQHRNALMDLLHDDSYEAVHSMNAILLTSAYDSLGSKVNKSSPISIILFGRLWRGAYNWMTSQTNISKIALHPFFRKLLYLQQHSQELITMENLHNETNQSRGISTMRSVFDQQVAVFVSDLNRLQDISPASSGDISVAEYRKTWFQTVFKTMEDLVVNTVRFHQESGSSPDHPPVKIELAHLDMIVRDVQGIFGPEGWIEQSSSENFEWFLDQDTWTWIKATITNPHDVYQRVSQLLAKKYKKKLASVAAAIKQVTSATSLPSKHGKQGKSKSSSTMSSLNSATFSLDFVEEIPVYEDSDFRYLSNLINRSTSNSLGQSSNKIIFSLRLFYSKTASSVNKSAPSSVKIPHQLSFLVDSPNAFAWQHAIQSFITSHHDVLLRTLLPSSSANLSTLPSDSTSNTILSSLASTMLLTSKSLAKSTSGSAASMTRPYHLHDYLHNPTMLHRLSATVGSPLCDFLILPITRWNAQMIYDKQNQVRMEEDDSYEEDFGRRVGGNNGSSSEDEFVHLLHIDDLNHVSDEDENSQHRLADLSTLLQQNSQMLTLPSRLCKMIKTLLKSVTSSKLLSTGNVQPANGIDGADVDDDEDFISVASAATSGRVAPSSKRRLKELRKQIEESLAKSIQSLSEKSLVSTLPEMGKFLFTYLNDLDAQLDGNLAELVIGLNGMDLDLDTTGENKQTYGEDVVDSEEELSDAESRMKHKAESIEQFVDPSSKVVLYSPCYAVPETLMMTSNSSGKTTNAVQASRSLSHPWATHYLLIAKKDRLILPSTIVYVQRILDEIFAPSQVIATGQPWFECVAGMERLLLAATSSCSNAAESALVTSSSLMHQNSSQNHQHRGSKAMVSSNAALSISPYSLPHEKHVSQQPVTDTSFTVHRGKQLLSECMSILKSSVGDRYIASVGYLLAADKKGLSVSSINGHKDLVYLVRSCSDSHHHHHSADRYHGTDEHHHRWELGPTTLSCPATSRVIRARYGHATTSHRHHHHGHDSSNRFAHIQYQFEEHHYVGLSTGSGKKVHMADDSRGNGDHFEDVLMTDKPQIHYLEMTSSQLNEMLVTMNDSTGENRPLTVNVGLGGSAAGVLLRQDIRVLQVLITSNFSTSGSDSDPHEDLVVASMLIYISTGDVTILDEDDYCDDETSEIGRYGRSSSRGRNRSHSRSKSPMSRHGRKATKERRERSRSRSLPRSKATYLDIQSALGRGLMHGLMRVIDITGSLISSLYQRKHAELLYDQKIAQDLTTVQSERDYLYNLITKLSNVLVNFPDEDMRSSSVILDGDEAVNAILSVSQSYDLGSADSSSASLSASASAKERQNLVTSSKSPTGMNWEVIASMKKAVLDQIHRYQLLRQEFHVLQDQYQVLEHDLHDTRKELEDVSTTFTTYFAFMDEIFKKFSGISIATGDIDALSPNHSLLSKKFHHKITSAVGSATAPLMPDLSDLTRTILQLMTYVGTLQKALHILSEVGFIADLTAYSEEIARSLFSYQQEVLSINLPKIGMLGENRANSNSSAEILKNICVDLEQLDHHFSNLSSYQTHQYHHGTHTKVSRLKDSLMFSMDMVDYSIIWCNFNGIPSTNGETANNDHHNNHRSEEVRFTSGCVLLPDKLIQSLVHHQIVVADGSDLVYPLPLREPFLQYFSSKGLIVNRIFYVPIICSTERKVQDNPEGLCAVIQCIVYDQGPTGQSSSTDVHNHTPSHRHLNHASPSTTPMKSVKSPSNLGTGHKEASGLMSKDELLTSFATQYITTITKHLLDSAIFSCNRSSMLEPISSKHSAESKQLIHRSAGGPTIDDSDLVLANTVDWPCNLWSQMSNTMEVAVRITSQLPSLTNALGAMEMTNKSLHDNLFTPQFLVAISRLASTWSRGKASLVAIESEHRQDVNTIYQALLRYVSSVNVANVSSQLPGSTHHHHNHGNSASSTKTVNVISRFRQLLKDLYNPSSQGMVMAPVEVDMLPVGTDRGNGAVCYPQWVILAMIALDPPVPGSSSIADDHSVVSSYMQGGKVLPPLSSNGIALLMIQVDHVPTSMELQIVHFLLLLIQQSVMHFHLSGQCAKQFLELRSLSTTLEITSKTLMDSQDQSYQMTQIWQLLNSINPSFAANCHLPLIMPSMFQHSYSTDSINHGNNRQPILSLTPQGLLDDLTMLQDRYFYAMDLLQQWLSDGNELSKIFGLANNANHFSSNKVDGPQESLEGQGRLKARLLPVSAHEMHRVLLLSQAQQSPAISSFPSKRDVVYNDLNPQWFERFYAQCKSLTESFFLPTNQASDFLGSKHLEMYQAITLQQEVQSGSGDGVLSVLAALSLQSCSIIIDDLRASTNNSPSASLTVILPLSREYDLSGAESKDIEKSLDIKLRDRLINEFSINLPQHRSENGRFGGLTIESYCSNWALMIELKNAEDREKFLTILGAIQQPSRVHSQDQEEEQDPAELARNRQQLLEMRRHVLTSLMMNIRQWLIHHREEVARVISITDDQVVNTTVRTFVTLNDQLHQVEGLLTKSADQQPSTINGSSDDHKLFRMENVAAIISHTLQSSSSSSSSSILSIENAFVHWSSSDSSISLSHPTAWKMAKLHHNYGVQLLLDRTGGAYGSLLSEEDQLLFDATEQEMLAFSRKSAWEVTASTLSESELTRCLSSEENQVILVHPSIVERDGNGLRLTVLIGNITSTTSPIPFVLQCNLAYQYPSASTTSSPSSLVSRILEDRQIHTLVSNIRETINHITYQLFIQQRRHVLMALLSNKLKQVEARQFIVSQCIQTFTCEGSSTSSVLTKFQSLLSHLPGIATSHLTCRDSATDRVIFDEKVVYTGTSSGGGNATVSNTGVGVGLAGGGLGIEEVLQVNQQQDVDILFSPVSSSLHRGQGNSVLGPFSPLPSKQSMTSGFFSPTSTQTPLSSSTRNQSFHFSALLQSPPGRAFSFFKTEPEKQGGESGGVRESTIHASITTHYPQGQEPQMETSFDCHEIIGKLVVTFVSMNAQHHYQSPYRGQSGNQVRSRTSTPTPGRVKFQQGEHSPMRDSDFKNDVGQMSIITSTVTPAQIFYDLEFQQVTESLLETLARGLVRRVFELHRGAMNKKLMAMKKQELNMKSMELAEKSERVESLEITNNMTAQELQAVAKESERLRLIMQSEQKHLKESLHQKKEMNAHLRQSLVEIRRETEKKEVILTKQIKELREKCVNLEVEREKEKKELHKFQNKEHSISAARNELSRQLTEVQKAHQDAETMVKQLKVELMTLQAREASFTETSDIKMKGLLQKVRALEDELTSARGTNSFLKKQLEAANQSLRVAQEDHARQLSTLQGALLSQSVSSSVMKRSASSHSVRESQSGMEDLRGIIGDHQRKADEMTRKARDLTAEKNQVVRNSEDA